MNFIDSLITTLSVFALLVNVFGRKNLMKIISILINLKAFRVGVVLFIIFIFGMLSIGSFRAGLIMTIKEESFYIGMVYFIVPQILFTAFCVYYYDFCFGKNSKPLMMND